jgi:hypothetical protein
MTEYIKTEITDICKSCKQAPSVCECSYNAEFCRVAYEMLPDWMVRVIESEMVEEVSPEELEEFMDIFRGRWPDGGREMNGRSESAVVPIGADGDEHKCKENT